MQRISMLDLRKLIVRIKGEFKDNEDAPDLYLKNLLNKASSVSPGDQKEAEQANAWAKKTLEDWDKPGATKTEALKVIREQGAKVKADKEAKERAEIEAREQAAKDAWDLERREKEKQNPLLRSRTPTRIAHEKNVKREEDEADVLPKEGRHRHYSIDSDSPASSSGFFSDSEDKDAEKSPEKTPQAHHRRNKSA